MQFKEKALMTIRTGVHQGSISGPRLFLVYVNDITNVSNLFHFILFAAEILNASWIYKEPDN